MRRALELIALGVAALVLQGVLAAFVGPHWVPDLGLLLVVHAALVLGGATGLAVSASLGFAADLLSGALFGQHALLRIGTFLLARMANGQLHLHRAGPLAILVFGLTLAHGAALLGLAALFEGRAGWSGGLVLSMTLHAFVNALCASPVLTRLSRWFGGEPPGGRTSILLTGRTLP